MKTTVAYNGIALWIQMELFKRALAAARDREAAMILQLDDQAADRRADIVNLTSLIRLRTLENEGETWFDVPVDHHSLAIALRDLRQERKAMQRDYQGIRAKCRMHRRRKTIFDLAYRALVRRGTKARADGRERDSGSN